jgi:hypothetical protein
METVALHGPRLGVGRLYRALAVPRATYYRHLEAKAPPPRPTPTRALSVAERRAVLDVLHEPRFTDQAPAEVYARLLDENRRPRRAVRRTLRGRLFFLHSYTTTAYTAYTQGVLPDDVRDVEVSFGAGGAVAFKVFVDRLATAAAAVRVGEEEWPVDPYFGQTFLFKEGEVFAAGLPFGMLTIEATIESFGHLPERVVGLEVEGRGKVVQFFYRLPNGREHMVVLAAPGDDLVPKPPDPPPGTDPGFGVGLAFAGGSLPGLTATPRT